MRVASTILPLAGSLMADASLVSAGCRALNAQVNNAVFFQNSSVYEYEAQEFWSNTELMYPGCVFRPQSSAQLGKGVQALVNANAQFAVRGGGHREFGYVVEIFTEVCWILTNFRDRTTSITVC
jgi:hypothetical protein